ncbi:amino acid adenylation domain-containing protein [Fulvivirga aurantia]|uniref:amino acid adenylation domain-containing protein n=1 Tax=Fulvivirga aurantia TaxID=2529383 RepID=UPI001FEC0CE9|nr:amino acid adenylation domain-containing protein [Fulvivirga aurantia]
MSATPERVAIIDGEKEISYRQLEQRTHEVAGELLQRGLSPGSLVGVCMNRSWELVATLLGVMQAGYAYIPLDPAYPEERVRYMLEHSRAAAAIVDNDQTAKLCACVKELVNINEIGNHTDSSVKPGANDLAYIIYTSGSTGQPKGVAIEHRGIVGVRNSMRELFSDDELSGMLAAASVCFDTSVMEIMGTLSLGGTIILAKNAIELTQLPAVDKIKTCVMVASAVQAILATEKLPKNIECLVFGGEALKRSLVKQVFALGTVKRILNAYGPTEDTVYSTIAEITPETEVITIGKSVPNSQAYILDENLQPISDGTPGELYLAGSKLARGYLYDDALTNQRFLEIEPRNGISHQRLYKTGDLCRWTPNQEIEFLGRVDQQVKIRGYRIELGEIESTLETMPGIEAAAAAAVESNTGRKILAVYIVSNGQTVSEESVKAYIAQRLPKYMVPQVVKHLDALPTLPNDKLDRKQLMNMTEEQVTENQNNNSTVALSEKLKASDHDKQAAILEIIQQELAVLLNLPSADEVTPLQSFDSLGLDSLTTFELSSRLTRLLGVKVPPHAIFEHSTPEALINYVVGSTAGKVDCATTKSFRGVATDTLSNFQTNIQSSHPTFQAAKAPAWNANDKSKLVQEVLKMVNNDRRNPYSKVLRTGSATKGLVGDAYNDEEQEAIIWTTNLYLGLNRDPKVMEEASASLARFGTGMGTSAAASGMTNQHLEFETEFAELVGKPSACLFPTGYTANVGAVAGLLGNNDVVVIDQLCHASIVDGARLCGATIRTFKHNNADDLEAVLQSEVSPYRSILVVLEGVYSMGEGAAPVAKIVRTAKKYNALVLVDEAHSFGFYGEKGAGICAAQGVTKEVDFIMTTLSKALGSLGGVVAASQEHVDLLKSSSRAYIFQASVSPADMAAALTSLRCLRSDDALRERLWDTTRYMRKRFEDAGYDLGTGDGPIVTPHFSDKDKLYAIVQGLYKKGIQTSAVTYPIVESGRGRLRLICSAAHTKDDVDRTVEALIEVEREVDKEFKTKEKTNSSPVSYADLQVWANSFECYLTHTVSKNPEMTPDLEIVVSVPGKDNAVVITLSEGTVAMNKSKSDELPACSLLLTDDSALLALQSYNVQGLLKSICDGTCLLNGQVEPFIWLIARLVEKGIETNKTAESVSRNTEAMA